MAVLKIRNLPEHVHAMLGVRAAKAGRSVESEALDILARACQLEVPAHDALSFTLGLPNWVDSLFGTDRPSNVVDALIAERRREAASE